MGYTFVIECVAHLPFSGINDVYMKLLEQGTLGMTVPLDYIGIQYQSDDLRNYITPLGFLISQGLVRLRTKR